MSPLDLAKNLAKSDDLKDRALGVAMVARGLSDDDPATLKQGWPLASAVPAAAQYLDLEATPELVAMATEIAATVSDAMLNKGASAR